MTMPSHEPTDEVRKRVQTLTAYGISQEEIANMEDIDPKTLRKYYRHELDIAKPSANAKVAETCYKMATSGQTPSATFFWLKTQAGWREKQEIHATVQEITGFEVVED